MPQLTLGLIKRIYNKKITGCLFLEGHPDFGSRIYAEVQFWNKFRDALEHNGLITGLHLFKISEGLAIDITERVLLTLPSKINYLLLQDIDALSIEKLLPALQSPLSKVTRLDICELTVSALEKLLPALQSPLSTISSLGLNGEITIEVMKKLLTGLQASQSKVTTLHLISVDNRSVEILLPVLQHPASNITILDLYKLSSTAVQTLLSALQNPESCITTLVLSTLTADAVQSLQPMLKNPQSNIRNITLNNLTVGAIGKLATILRDPNCNITQLSVTDLKPSALKRLLGILTNAKCKIQNLSFMNELTNEKFEIISAALQGADKKLSVSGYLFPFGKIKFINLSPEHTVGQGNLAPLTGVRNGTTEPDEPRIKREEVSPDRLFSSLQQQHGSLFLSSEERDNSRCSGQSTIKREADERPHKRRRGA